MLEMLEMFHVLKISLAFKQRHAKGNKYGVNVGHIVLWSKEGVHWVV